MNSAYPNDHFLDPTDVDPYLCFVVSPFASEFDGPLAIIKRAADAVGLRVVRADEIVQGGVIHADIWRYVAQAAVVVADLTEWNPNVMLEVGVAAATRPVEQLLRAELSAHGTAGLSADGMAALGEDDGESWSRRA